MPQDSTIPVAEFDPKSGAPLFPPEYYSKKYGVSPEQYNLYAKGTGAADAKPARQGTTKVVRGTWLKNKMQSLNEDPVFKNASEAGKSAFKEKAYKSWVVPYYKHIGMTPPSMEDFVSGKHNFTLTERANEKIQNFRSGLAKDEAVAMKTAVGSAKSIAGGLGDFTNWMFDFTEEGVTNPVGDSLKKAEKYLGEKEQFWQQYINQKHGDTTKDRWYSHLDETATEIGTQAVMFEATGASKAAKVFQLANPKTASVMAQVGKAAYNGAVDGLFFGAATNRDKAGEYAAGGAVLGGLGKGLKIGLWDRLQIGIKSASQYFQHTPPSVAKQAVGTAIQRVSQPPTIYTPSGDVIPVTSKMLSGIKYTLPVPDAPVGLLPKTGTVPPNPDGLPAKAYNLIRDNVTKAGGKFLGISKLKDNSWMVWFNSPNHQSTQALITTSEAPTVEAIQNILKQGEVRMGVSQSSQQATNLPENHNKAVQGLVDFIHNNAIDKYNKHFSELKPGQQRMVLIDLLKANVDAKISMQRTGVSYKVMQAYLAEEEEKVVSQFPKAKQIQKLVDGYVGGSGIAPAADIPTAKYRTLLPHHMTTEESPVKHISARISFLKNSLRSAKTSEEKEALTQAIKEEKELLAKVSDKLRKQHERMNQAIGIGGGAD